MRNLKLLIYNSGYIDPVVVVNGQKMELKNVDNYYVANYCMNSPDDKIILKIAKVYEASKKSWRISAFLFYLFGCFGLFTPKYERRCPYLDFETQFRLKESTEIRIDFNPYTEGAPAFSIMSPVLMNLSNSSNVYFRDKVAEKESRNFNLICWISQLLIILGLALFFTLRFLLVK